MSSSLARILPWCLPVLVSLSPIASAAEPRAETVQSPNQKQEAKMTVNVFGAVEKPGACPLPPSSTLLDALGAAGGCKSTANQNKISVLSGPAGEKPSVSIYDLDAILRGKAPNPKLQDHDSIVVTEKIF